MAGVACRACRGRGDDSGSSSLDLGSLFYRPRARQQPCLENSRAMHVAHDEKDEKVDSRPETA